jgi:hypothetical protein
MQYVCGGEVCFVPAFHSAVRRSIYTLHKRTTPLTMFEVFDAPQLQPNCLKRGYSTVSTQAMQLMNGDIVRESARHFSGRVIDAVGLDTAKQVEQVYLVALSRPPSREEMIRSLAAVQNLTRRWLEQLDKEVVAEPKRGKAQWLALASFCHTILNSPDFVYID